MSDLETNRLRLRLLTPEIYNNIFNTYSDEELSAFLGLKDQEQLDREKERYRLGFTMFNKSFRSFKLIDKQNGNVIGSCGFHTWFTQHNRAEIGYDIEASYRRKGLMEEALTAILDHGFAEMNLNRVEALTANWNEASKGLLNKLGFSYEGVLRAHYLVDGVHEDSEMYALLRSEWKK